MVERDSTAADSTRSFCLHTEHTVGITLLTVDVANGTGCNDRGGVGTQSNFELNLLHRRKKRSSRRMERIPTSEPFFFITERRSQAGGQQAAPPPQQEEHTHPTGTR